ncbi:MAG: serine hydrolase [Coriobacteriales bacterium]|nr:serine hydrolase [Coriobacteriales bacterium]
MLLPRPFSPSGKGLERLWGALLIALGLALTCTLCACAQKQEEATPQTNTEAKTETTVTTTTTDAATTEDKTTQDSPSDVKATSSAKPETNEALAQKWSDDLSKIAEGSGMDMCVSAIDLTTGATATYKSDQRMLSASMIKLLIAETFLRQTSEGKHSLDDVYTLEQSDIVGGAGSLGGRGAGAQVSKRELVQKMIAESDNVATNVLIDLCGMDAINAEAKRLDLKQTELGRHMMDTQAANEGHDNYTCADDIATLLKMVYDKTFANEEMSAFMLEVLEAQTDNDCISTGLPQGTKFAHKTGSLDTVRHDGGIVEDGKPFVLVALCGGEGFSEQGAQEVMGQLGEVAYSDINA